MMPRFLSAYPCKGDGERAQTIRLISSIANLTISVNESGGGVGKL
ncbi:hypothetical protein [Adlercreutzia aquisgranensis]|nr:hypothetical protein [Adlercreutzia aquisgranensis]